MKAQEVLQVGAAEARAVEWDVKEALYVQGARLGRHCKNSSCQGYEEHGGESGERTPRAGHVAANRDA